MGRQVSQLINSNYLATGLGSDDGVDASRYLCEFGHNLMGWKELSLVLIPRSKSFFQFATYHVLFSSQMLLPLNQQHCWTASVDGQLTKEENRNIECRYSPMPF